MGASRNEMKIRLVLVVASILVFFGGIEIALREANKAKPLHIPNDRHWNEAGHAVVAQQLADFLATMQ